MVVEGDAAYWLDYMKRVEGAASYLTVGDIVTNKYNGALK